MGLFTRKTKKTTRRTPFAKLFRLALVTLGLGLFFTLVWYIWNRVQSGARAVKRYQRQTADVEKSGTPPMPEKLRVGIYNVAHGRGDAEYGQAGILENLFVNMTGGSSTERITRLNNIADYLASEDLDIIILNEVDFRVFWSGNINQATYIAERTGHPWILEQRNHDLDLPFLTIKFGNAVLSRYPIDGSALLDFPAYRWWENVLLGRKKGAICQIKLPDGRHIRVAPVHLDVRSTDVRLESVKVLAEIAERRPDRPMIAAGDFNSTRPDWPKAQPNAQGVTAVSYLTTQHGFLTRPVGDQPAPEDLTFATSDPVKVIDWVMVTPPLDIADHKVGDISFSDHFPVISTVTLSGSPAETEKPEPPSASPAP